MKHTQRKWVVIDSGGRVMLKAVGEPQIICTLETTPLKITPKVEANAHLIAAAPELLEACESSLRWFDEAIANNIIVQTPEPAFSIRNQLQTAIAEVQQNN